MLAEKLAQTLAQLHWNRLHNGSAVVQESVQAFLPAFLFFRFFFGALCIYKNFEASERL